MGLALAGREENHEGLGLAVSCGWLDADSDGARPRVLAVTCKPKRGAAIVLNYCPWCCVWLRTDENEPAELAERRRA
jgi:hypothetical protein